MPLADGGIFSKRGCTASCPARWSSFHWAPTRPKPAERKKFLRPNLTRARLLCSSGLQAKEFRARPGCFLFSPEFCVRFSQCEINLWVVRQIASGKFQFRDGCFGVSGVRIELTQQVVTDGKSRA